MKPLFDLNILDKIIGTGMRLKFECEYCNSTFTFPSKEVRRVINGNCKNIKINFCSLKCAGLSLVTKVSVSCKNCDKKFEKIYSQSIKHPNHFCSRSCAATFNNKNKTHGTRRSKFEQYVEGKLKIDFPKLTFLSNDKTTIFSELDFIFPDMNIAIEINGITHYKPIYGQKKYEMIIANDADKQKLCIENNIQLYVINVSDLTYNCEKNFVSYYENIKSIINKKTANH